MSTMIRFQWQPMSFNHILEQRFASSESQTCMIVIKLVFGNKNKKKLHYKWAGQVTRGGGVPSIFIFLLFFTKRKLIGLA